MIPVTATTTDAYITNQPGGAGLRREACGVAAGVARRPPRSLRTRRQVSLSHRRLSGRISGDRKQQILTMHRTCLINHVIV